MGRGKSRKPGFILEEHSENGNSISGMPRQCPTQRDQRPARPARARLARRWVLACAFAALVAGGPALAAGGAEAAAHTAAHTAQVTVGITSVSPQVARPGQPVTVQGTVSNPTRAAVSGLSVQLQSSSTPLSSRGALSEYAAGNLPVLFTVTGPPAQLAGTLAPGEVDHWSIRIPAASLALASFGVYPLAAQVDSGARAAPR